MTTTALDNVGEVAELLKGIAEPTRLRILLLLANKPMCVTSLMGELETEAHTIVSHHLAILRLRHLATAQRQGKTRVYTLTPQGHAVVKFVRHLL